MANMILQEWGTWKKIEKNKIMRKELQYERENEREKEGERDCWGK